MRKAHPPLSLPPLPPPISAPAAAGPSLPIRRSCPLLRPRHGARVCVAAAAAPLPSLAAGPARRLLLRFAAALLSAAVLLCAAAPAARAEKPAATAEETLARALKAGAAAAARGDHSACVEAYSQALRLAPAATTTGRLGLCEEALGRDIVAYDLLRLAQESEPPPARGGRQALWKRIEAAVIRLERRVARPIVITVPKDAEVFLDGVSLGSKLSGRYVTVAPGDHTWLAKRDGYLPATFTHTARAGDMPDVRLFCDPIEALQPLLPAAMPCDEACRAKLQKSAEDATNLKWELKFDGEVERLRQEAKLIYGEKVNPSVALLGGFLGSIGLTADPGPGFFLGGEAHWGAYDEVGISAGVETRALFPTKALIRSDGKPLDISQVTAALVPCVRYKWVAGCAIADVGVIIGGGPPPLTFRKGGIVTAFGVGPRLAFQFPFAERFMVRAFAELRISPLDTGFVVGANDPRIWHNPLVCGLFGLGFSFGNPVRLASE